MPKPTFFNLPEDKRRLILDLAIDEFASHDYRAASVSRIVARAGIAKGSLYQYFDDKRDLYFYLLSLAVEEKKRFLAQARPPDPAADLFDLLRWQVREGAHFELSRPRLAQVAYRALFTDRPFGDEPFEHIRGAVDDYYRHLVDTGIRQGSIDRGIDRDMAVFAFSTLLNEFGRYVIERLSIDPADLATGDVRYQDLPVAELADQLIDILQRGLAPRHPEKESGDD